MTDSKPSRRNFLALAGIGGTSLVLDACNVSPAPEPTAAAVQSLIATGVLTVANVLDFASPQAAASSLTSGGILYFPAGVHLIAAPIVLLPQTWVLGAGTASILRRTAGASILTANNALGLRFSNLAFEMNANTVAGATGISLTGTSTDITVEHCHFEGGDPVNAAGAFAATEPRDVRFSGNYLSRCDVTVMANSSGSFVRVSRNRIVSPKYGVRAQLAVGASLTHVTIEDNEIENPYIAGISVGPLTESVLALDCSALIVRGNTINGTWGPGACGILGRFAQQSRDWHISGNVIESAVFVNNSLGILLPGNALGSTLASVEVASNRVIGVDHAGITLAGSVRGFVIASNILERTRGIVIAAAAGRPVAEGVVSGNIIRNVGLFLDANSADVGPVLVRNNTCLNNVGWECAGIRLRAGTGFRIKANVTANRSSDDQTTKTQWFGIKEEGTGVFETRYVANDLRGNYSRGVGPVHATAQLADNLGVTTSARGTASFPAGSVAVSVPLALQVVPGLADVALTLTQPPASWVSAGTGRIWVNDVSASSLGIRCSPAPAVGETVGISYRVLARDLPSV